jgi:hypothetical protein
MTQRGLIDNFFIVMRNYAGDECVRWPFGGNRVTYPSIRMLTQAKGPKPLGKAYAAHSCGNAHKLCVNPNHLYWATPQENSHDRHLHGTSHGRSGPNNTSGCVGVQPHRRKWRAFLAYKGVHHTLGIFKHFADAVEARASAEIRYNVRSLYSNK